MSRFAMAVLALSLLSTPQIAVAQQPSITVGVNTEPDVLDMTSSRNTPIAAPVMRNITDTLVSITTDGKIVPGLAEWTYLDGGKTIELKLRRGVKFHSGDPFTAQDVVFSHERMKEKGIYYARSIRAFDHAEIVDDYTVRLHFKRPDVTYLPAQTLYIVSKAYHDRVGEEEFRRKPVGTGPYKFVDYKFGQSIDLEANPDYWGGKPKYDRVRFVFAKEDSTRVAMLKAGEVDIITNVPFTAVDDLKKSGFHTVGISSHPTVSLVFNFANPTAPWKDLRVRQAMAMAIDGDSITGKLFHGVPKRYPRLAPGDLGYDPSIKNYPYDVAKAKALMKEAGYANGFSVPLYFSTGTYSNLKETAETVALYLRAIGINMTVQGQDITKMVDLTRRSKTDEKAFFLTIGTTPFANYAEPTDSLNFTFHSSAAGNTWNRPDVDKEIDTAKMTVDPTERAKHIQAVVRIMHEDIPTVTLWNQEAVFAMKPGFDFTPTKRLIPSMFVNDLVRK